MTTQPESPAEMLQRSLRISDALANKLVAGGISSLEEVAYVPVAELREIGALWDEEATSLRNRARDHLANEATGGRSLDDLAKGMLMPNNSLERPGQVRGPRLSAAWALCLAAQLKR